MNISEFLAHLDGVKKSWRGYVALCPVHDDKRPSLSIGEGRDGRILLYCHACNADVRDIVDALGLKPRDLFSEGRRR